MCALVTCLGGVWSVEQPSGSILNYYPAWRALVQGVCNTGGPHSVSCLHLVTFQFYKDMHVGNIELYRLHGWRIVLC